MRVVFQSCHTNQPTRHFFATIETPVSVPSAAAFLPSSTADALRLRHPSLQAPMWGFAPTGPYLMLWKSLAQGDIIAFHRGGRVFAVGFVSWKWESLELSAHLWGFDAHHSARSWDLMISLHDVQEGDVPLSQFGEAIGKRLDAEQRGAIPFDLDSADESRISSLIAPFSPFRHYRTPSPFRPIPVMGGELVVFVALQEELDFLVSRWDLTAPIGKEILSRSTYNGSIYGICDVRVLPAFAMGRVPAILTLSDYLASSPQDVGLVISFGLAGGFLMGGVSPGDVVVATEVIDLGTRKVFDGRLEFRERTYRVDGRALSGFRNIRHKVMANIKFGPLASVDEIVASANYQSSLNDAGWRKYLGVDMESAAVLAVCSDERFNLPAVAVRGISDRADVDKKDDEVRVVALENAANAIEVFLRELGAT